MNIKIYLRKIAKNYSTRARTKRAKLFRNYFKIDKNTKILDLGSEDGSNIFSVLSDADITPSNIYIADIKLSLIVGFEVE